MASLDTKMAVLAVRFCRLHRLTTADAIIYATAQSHAGELLTCDAHFEGLADVVLIRKPRVG